MVLPLQPVRVGHLQDACVTQAKHRRAHARDKTRLRHVRVVEYSCASRGLHAAAQCTCASVRVSTLLHFHASHDSCRSFFCCGRITAKRASSCIMPIISDRSEIVKGRSPPKRRGKRLFFTSKRNERDTRHILAAATRLHLPPETIWNLVEIVRFHRRLSKQGRNRPHLFQWPQRFTYPL